MVVCHCRVVNDRTLEQILEDPEVTDISHITERCGAGGDCGRCYETIGCVMEKIRGE